MLDHAPMEDRDTKGHTYILANPPFVGSLDYEGTAKDDKRQPPLAEDKLGFQPMKNGRSHLTEAEHAKNNLPDVLARWGQRDGSEQERERTEQSFCVPKCDIESNDPDLSINRYKEVVHAVSEHLQPKEILARLAVLEAEIAGGMKALEERLETAE